MRILPLAFLPEISDETIADVSAMTHNSSVCKEVCIIYVRIAKSLLDGIPLDKAIQRYIEPASTYTGLLNVKDLPKDAIANTSHAPVALTAALWCLSHSTSYQQCVLEAVSLGDDANTVAAIAGGLAGILYGINSIPVLWRLQLSGKKLIKECLFDIPLSNSL